MKWRWRFRAALRALMVAAALTGPLAAVPAARADTPATCTTGTQTTYCQTIDSGTEGGPAASGFVMAEAAMGVLLGMLFAFVTVKRLLRSAM